MNKQTLFFNFTLILSLLLFFVSGVNAQCSSKDFDGDGIGNFCDQDNDNDGILDNNEKNTACKATTDMEFSVYTENYDPYMYMDGQPILRTFYINLANYGPLPSSAIDSAKVVFGLPYVGVVETVMVDVATLTFAYTFIAGVYDSWDPEYSTDFCLNKSVEILGGTVYFSNGTIEVPLNPYSMAFCEGGDGWGYMTPVTYYDCDNDHTPNRFDNDSDNDGCPDAIEAAGSISSTDVFDGKITGGVDINGIPLLTSGGQANAPAVIDDQLLDCNNKTMAFNDFNNTPFQIPVTSNVLTNDSDAAGDHLTASLISSMPVAEGTVTLDANGTYVFIPATGYYGETSFIYEVCDDGTPQECKEAKVTIEVLHKVDPAYTSILANADNSTTEGGVPISNSLFTNDYDPEATAFTITSLLMDTDGNGKNDNLVKAGSSATVYGKSQTSNIAEAGVLKINSNGDYNFVPATDFVGSLVVDYTITDVNADGDASQFSIEVLDVVKNNTFAASDVSFTDVNMPINSNVKLNDHDPEADQTIITELLMDTDGNGIMDNTVQPGTVATVYGYDKSASPVPAGTLEIRVDGSYTYTPATDFIGNLVATYTICDDLSNKACDEAILNITVVGSYRDYGDAASAYPEAWTTVMTDEDGDNIPDAATAVWLGAKVAYETATKTNETFDAAADNFDDAMSFGNAAGQFPTDITPSMSYDVSVTLNGNQTGDIAYLGMWIDWNDDGVYDDFYPTSGIVNSAVAVLVSITAPATYITGTPVNVRLRSDDEVLTAAAFAGGITNGEVEDYLYDAVLPLEIGSFSGFNKGCVNVINWQTEIEVNTDNFVLMQSSDGLNFKALGSEAAAGNSLVSSSYSHSHQTEFKRTYYQLKTIDIDGTVTLSDVIVVNSTCQLFSNEMTLSPNPTIDDINLSFTASQGKSIEVDVVDAIGRIVMSEQQEISEGLNTIRLNTRDLGAGIYFVYVRGMDVEPLKFIKKE